MPRKRLQRPGWCPEPDADQKTERALGDGGVVLRTLMDHVDQGISIFDADLRLVAVNQRFRELLDLPESLVRPGVHLSEFFRFNAERGEYGPGAVEEQVAARLELAHRNEPHLFERERPDGTVLEIRGSPVPGGGFVSIHTDVTERARAERKLRQSEYRLRTIVDNEPECVKIVDRDGRLLEMNPAGLRMIEADSIEPLRGHRVEQLVVQEFRDAFRELTRRVADGEQGGLEFEIVGLKGTRRWLDMRAVPLPDTVSGRTLVLSLTRDITEHRRAEGSLRQSEARHRALTELSSDWYWQQDAELRFVSTGGASEARGGITPQAHIGVCRWELPGTEIVGGSWDEHKAELAARQPFHDLLLRRTPADGHVHYVSVSGRPLFEPDGTFAGYYGLAKDVTNRVTAELALRRFRAALDASADMVFLADARTSTYIDFNETALRSLGYARNELLGMSTDTVRVDRTLDQLLGDYRELRAKPGASDTSEGSYRRKDGSTFPVEVTRRVLETSDGPVLVANVRDLTERKRAEERQAAHLRLQERIARFGQSALAKRQPEQLIEEALQNILEGLTADAVAYLERGASPGELMLRSIAGVHAGEASRLAHAPGNPVFGVFDSGVRVVAEAAVLPFAWAQDAAVTAIVPVRADQRVRGVLCVLKGAARALGAEELSFVEAAVNVLSSGLQRIDSEGQLAFLAQFDPLTGLPNRTLLSDRFAQTIVQARRHGAPLGVLFIDLDEFKLVNDTLGHAAGDELLKEAARRLQATVRTGDTVARISGDEFAVVVPDLARPEDAALVAQKIIDQLAAPFALGGHEIFITASIGIAAFPADGENAETLLGAADAAMYRAKQSGRNAYQFFTADINQRTRARAQLGSELRRALEREELRLAYQPKFDLSSGAACGAEALLRWQHPERGLVTPAEFVPVLEETGLIVQVGEWVVRRVCQDIQAWRSAGLTPLSVAVNLSARQFRQPDLHRRIQSLVAAAGVEPVMIELEITESQLMHDPDHAIRTMRALRDAGMRIAIDDFGTGYSSLAYLTRFPVAALKIDRSFVAGIGRRTSDAAIVRMIIEMARTLGLTVVAEGVEDEAQVAYLRQFGCHQAQGYLFAMPMSAAELGGLFAKFCEDLPQGLIPGTA